MRAVAFLALMVAPAMGFSLRDVLKNNVEADAAEAGALPQVRGTARVNTKTNQARRDLKGSKGYKASKGRAARPQCETISVWTLQPDYSKNGMLIGNFGEALEGLPLYEEKTGRIIATITETVIDAGRDCTAVGSINFGLKKEQDGRTKDQLMYQGTCTGGLTNALTGGTGDFMRAKGVMHYKGSKANRFMFELFACESIA